MSAIPRAVLAEALQEAIGGGTLRAAVLTTFALEWAFALDEVLPTFVPHSLSAAPNARREELAEYLLAQEAALTLYCDAGHAGDFERASRVPLAVVPVRHRSGVFHPKVVLALVERDGVQRLVVAVSSANLTRASWWEWVECAHVTSIEDGARTWMRESLLDFVKYLHGQSVHRTDRRSASLIRTFLRRTQQAKHRSGSDETGVVRFVWNGTHGGRGVAETVAQTVGRSFAGGRLEVISPWFSPDGDKVLLDGLVERTGVREVLAVVPEDPEGRAQLPPDAVERLGTQVTWASLPQDVISSGPLPEAAPRHVHAKLYRFTRPSHRRQILLIGSFNLTPAAFAGRGNVEAGLVLDLPIGGSKAWLKAREAPTAFAPDRPEEEVESLPQSRLAPLRLTYDWETKCALADWVEPGLPPGLRLMRGQIEVLDLADGWDPGTLPEDQAARLREHLISSSPMFTVLTHTDEDLGFTIVTEIEVAAKPSQDVQRRLSDALADLLLDPETRRARHKPDNTTPDDEDSLDQEPPLQLAAGRSLFDSYAALYQAMANFREELTGLLDAGRTREVRHRLIGESSRCLGDLLTQAEKGAEQDPAMSLVVCWAIEEVLTALHGRLRHHRKAVEFLTARVGDLRGHLESGLGVDNIGDEEFSRFLQWARSEFARRGVS